MRLFILILSFAIAILAVVVAEDGARKDVDDCGQHPAGSNLCMVCCHKYGIGCASLPEFEQACSCNPNFIALTDWYSLISVNRCYNNCKERKLNMLFHKQFIECLCVYNGWSTLNAKLVIANNYTDVSLKVKSNWKWRQDFGLFFKLIAA